MKKRLQESELSAVRLRETMAYDPLTGVFTWRTKHWQAEAGDVAGFSSCGYVRVGVYGGQFMAHRLAWLYTYGQWPEAEVDHIDRNKSNNRIDNLRLVSHGQNSQNVPGRAGTSNHKGVCFDAARNKWLAQITLEGVNHRLGRFTHENDAASAYAAGARKYHTHNPAATAA